MWAAVIHPPANTRPNISTTLATPWSSLSNPVKIGFGAISIKKSWVDQFPHRQRYYSLAEKIYTITRDGSMGTKGHISRLPDVIHGMREKPDRIIVNGCTYLMAHTSEVTRDLAIPTVVNLNPIMIDGTGMCGVCRVTVGGKMKFACVDGPEFNGHDIDWKEFLARRKAYLREESLFFRRSDAAFAHKEGKCAWHE